MLDVGPPRRQVHVPPHLTLSGGVPTVRNLEPWGGSQFHGSAGDDPRVLSAGVGQDRHSGGRAASSDAALGASRASPGPAAIGSSLCYGRTVTEHGYHTPMRDAGRGPRTLTESSPGRSIRSNRLTSPQMERATASPVATGSHGVAGNRLLRRSPWAHGTNASGNSKVSATPLSGYASSGRSASTQAARSKLSGPNRASSTRTPSRDAGHGMLDRHRSESPALSNRSESSSKGRTGSPLMAGRTRSPQEHRSLGDGTSWRAASTCSEVLALLGPCRDMLRRAVGQPKGNGFTQGPPPRGAAKRETSSRPSHREIQKLGAMVTTMLACLGKLKEELEIASSNSPRGSKKELPLLAPAPETTEPASAQGLPLLPIVNTDPSAQSLPTPTPTAYPLSPGTPPVPNEASLQPSGLVSRTSTVAGRSTPPAPDYSTVVTIATAASEKALRNSSVTGSSTTAEAVTEQSTDTFELEGAIEHLNRRVEELETPAAKAADLEKVVKQLRARVTELEAREARVAELRTECGSLRMRIAELVAATVDCKSLEEDRNQLLDTISNLENNRDAPEVTGSSARPPAEMYC
mmetsp:Transcript_60945/g.108408  ORF Transcript_60945/g.108408 Transcript_60945/m.108408 type:complete len:577 (-) Transcript_60945:64-1794(-)